MRSATSVKTLKRILKKAGLKTTGRKAALTRRAKKAHLKLRGGVLPKRSNADGAKPGDEKTKPSTEPSTSPPTFGFSNETPAAASASAPAGPPPPGLRTPGGRRRSRHSRKWAY